MASVQNRAEVVSENQNVFVTIQRTRMAAIIVRGPKYVMNRVTCRNALRERWTLICHTAQNSIMRAMNGCHITDVSSHLC